MMWKLSSESDMKSVIKKIIKMKVSTVVKQNRTSVDCFHMQDRSPAQDLVGNGFPDHQKQATSLVFFLIFKIFRVCQSVWLFCFWNRFTSVLFLTYLSSLHPYHQSVYHINYQVY